MREKLVSYTPSDGYSNWNRALTETTQDIGEENIIQLQQKYIQLFLQNYIGHTVLMTFPKIRNFPYEKIDHIINNNDKVDLMYLSDIYTNQELYYKNDFHPTAQGHTIIAHDIFEFLNKDRTICK